MLRCVTCGVLSYSAPVSRSSLTDADVWSSSAFDTAAVDVSSQVVAVDCSILCRVLYLTVTHFVIETDVSFAS